MPKGSRVLMADDDAMLLEMYKERLTLAGYTVEAEDNGEALLAKVKEFNPDLIMLDIMMPKMDGYQTLASLKSDPTTKDIPVVMLSALMRDFNKEKAMEGGADDYLIKSEAMPSDVITKIEQVLVKYGKGGGGPRATIESNAPENLPPKEEPVVVANHIETQPVAPAKEESMPESPEKKKKSFPIVWVVVVIVLLIILVAYFFLKK